jgi:signal transduction histidine kinase
VETTDFNLSGFGIAWTFTPAVLALLGIILTVVYFRLITDAPLKLVFFAVLLMGYGGSMLQITQGNLIEHYSGPARLAFLGALILVPAIIYRTVIRNLEGDVLAATGEFMSVPPPPPSAEPPAMSARPNLLPSPANVPTISPIQRDSVHLLRTLGLILEGASPSDIPKRVVTTIVDTLKADVGVLLTLQDANYADIAFAYNRVLDTPISALALNLDQQPTLVNAIERHLQRPLYPDRNLDELKDLYTRLDIEQSGPAYFQPLVSGKELVAVLIIAMPYAGKELEDPESELLKGMAIIAGNLLSLSYAARDARLKAEERAILAMLQGKSLDDVQDAAVLAAHQEMQASLSFSREQVTELTRQITRLQIELDHERNRITQVLGDTEEGLSVSQRIIALNDEHQTLRQERDELADRLQEAETALAGATASGNESVLKSMIEGLTREKADLEGQRQRLHNELNQLRSDDQTSLMPLAMQNMVEQMGQESVRMERERDQLRNKLTDIETQLKALGIENTDDGLTQIISQLAEQRARLQTRNDALLLERDALLKERKQFEAHLAEQKEHESRIQSLQTEIKNLAADREALTRMRDQYRAERDEAVTSLSSIKQHRARLLAEAAGYQIELSENQEEQTRLREQANQITQRQQELGVERDRLAAKNQILTSERDQLLARLDGDRDRLKQIGEDSVGSLTRMIEEVSQQKKQLEQELRETQAALENARQQTSKPAPVNNASAPVLMSNREQVLGTVQELRTPLTSIVGYTDLLIDESAGILGEMQRKFLQRIAANVTRLTFMLDDLTRMVALDEGHLNLTPEPVNVVEIIEDVLTLSANQFREKGLTLNFDLQDDIPPLHADRDAIGQIVTELLTNAYLASPPHTRVYITAHRQEVKLAHSKTFAEPKDSVLISVEDSGGGIDHEDLQRVFSRKYKASNPLIQGLGDTGVGLSIAKSLAEVHNGALWLETRPGTGSIFYVAFPITAELEV